MMDSRGQLKVAEEKHPLRRHICRVQMAGTLSDTAIKLQALSLTLDDSYLLQEMASHVHISEVNMSNLTADMRDRGGVDVATLANNFGIGIEAAKRSRLVTTQRGVKRMIHPSLSVRFRTNDRHLRHHRLPMTCFTDTMCSNSKSRQCNKAAQVFCTADGWTRAFPMAKEKDAHEALFLLFHWDGLPNVMVMDGAKVQIQGGFWRKLREDGCHIKQTEPHTLKSNAAEGSIRELKRGVGHEMVRSGAPKRLWDDCSVREAYVRSSTTLEIFSLEGQVPHTIVKVQNSDISPLAEYAWYEWLKLRDTGQSFPDSKEWLGRELGPAIDIGPATLRKVLNINGEVMFRVSVRGLTLD
jgi:hypothetical protein